MAGTDDHRRAPMYTRHSYRSQVLFARVNQQEVQACTIKIRRTTGCGSPSSLLCAGSRQDRSGWLNGWGVFFAIQVESKPQLTQSRVDNELRTQNIK
jgi:hypothetical protein